MTVLQAPDTVPPLPAAPPIGGPVWTFVVPALLFAIAFVATFLLYRHFARHGRGDA